VTASFVVDFLSLKNHVSDGLENIGEVAKEEDVWRSKYLLLSRLESRIEEIPVCHIGLKDSGSKLCGVS